MDRKNSKCPYCHGTKKQMTREGIVVKCIWCLENDKKEKEH